jgi:hypothetical protein
MAKGIEIKITQSDLDRLNVYPRTIFEIKWGRIQPIRSTIKGNLLFQLDLSTPGMTGTEVISIVAPKNGFFVPSRLGSVTPYRVTFKSVDELLSCVLGMMFDDYFDAIAYIIGKPCGVLKNDPFSHTDLIDFNWSGLWRGSGGSFEIGEMLFMSFVFTNNNAQISFSTDAEIYYDRHRFGRIYDEDVLLNKGDNISLLFDDGSILDFTAKTKPIEGNTFSCTLYQEDIDTLLQKKLVSYRITFSKEGRASLNGSFINRFFHIYSEEALQYYLKLFLNEVQQQLPQYQFPTRSVKYDIDKYVFNWCYVYLMRDNTNGYHKIGISNKPEYREKTLQSEKPSIEMLACKKFPTRKIAEAIESALHTAYSQQRVRGEWFNLDDVDVAAIIETLK